MKKMRSALGTLSLRLMTSRAAETEGTTGNVERGAECDRPLINNRESAVLVRYDGYETPHRHNRTATG